MSIVKNISFTYPRSGSHFHLNISEIEILDQGVTALVGASGSGKSTLFRLLLGLEACPCMEWWVGSQNIATLPVEKRNLGVVFQSLELFPHMTGLENLEFAASARKVKGKEKRIFQLLNKLEINEFKNQRVDQLSGGQKQRFALARALVSPVRYLLLDEPFSALDPGLRNTSRQLVKHIIDIYKVPTVLITHDEEDVQVLADRVIRLSYGQVVGVQGVNK